MTFLLLVTALSLAQADDYRWVHSPTDPGRLYLYRGAVQIGGYDLEEHYYRPFDGSSWGEKSQAPLPPPCFGVTSNKIGAGPTYRINGRPVTPRAAYESVEKGLDDDDGKLRVSFIGPTALRQDARSAFENHPEFDQIRGDVTVRDFPPDHWALKAGFVTTGQPTVYCQTPDGKVLHRQDDFAGGAGALIAALRKARASYDPRRDPDLRSPLAALRNYASFAVAGLLGVVACVVIRSRTA